MKLRRTPIPRPALEAKTPKQVRPNSHQRQKRVAYPVVDNEALAASGDREEGLVSWNRSFMPC